MVVTQDSYVEYCSVFSWNNHIYIFVSAALIGRPFDHPEKNGLKVWEWLAHHEISHVQGNDLPWLFYKRRLFRLASILYCIHLIIVYIFSLNQMPNIFAWLVLGAWAIQSVVALVCEWRADVYATCSIKIPADLKEAEKKPLSYDFASYKKISSTYGVD